MQSRRGHGYVEPTLAPERRCSSSSTSPARRSTRCPQSAAVRGRGHRRCQRPAGRTQRLPQSRHRRLAHDAARATHRPSAAGRTARLPATRHPRPDRNMDHAHSARLNRPAAAGPTAPASHGARARRRCSAARWCRAPWRGFRPAWGGVLGRPRCAGLTAARRPGPSPPRRRRPPAPWNAPPPRRRACCWPDRCWQRARHTVLARARRRSTPGCMRAGGAVRAAVRLGDGRLRDRADGLLGAVRGDRHALSAQRRGAPPHRAPMRAPRSSCRSATRTWPRCSPACAPPASRWPPPVRARLFDVYVLSDSNDPDVRAPNSRPGPNCATRSGDGAARATTAGASAARSRKAGNVADFCRRWGRNYRYMVVLDADSVMSGDCLVTPGAADGGQPAAPASSRPRRRPCGLPRCTRARSSSPAA